MTRLNGGRSTYGHVLGVLMLDTAFPRPVGDIGHAATWPFPVLYRTVSGATPTEVVWDRDGAHLKAFIDAALELQDAAVQIITTSCGFLAQFQQQLADALSVPVVTSSLIQVPLVASLIGPSRRVGILTVSTELGERHFRGTGFDADSTPIAVGILPRDSEFVRIHGAFDGIRTDSDTQTLSDEVAAQARQMVEEHPDLGAIVLECTNLVPYAARIRQETGLPVFDIYTAVSLVASSRRLVEPGWALAQRWDS